MSERILVWDVPTRVFHWLLVAGFAAAFVTGDSERWRDIHVALGYSVAGLLLFRLGWGLMGSRYARFRALPLAPSRLARYLRALLCGQPEHYVGHNPAGSWMILALLGAGLVTAASGLAAYEDWAGEWAARLHEGVAESMLALAGVHLAGVLVSSAVHRENLVRAMIDGYKRGAPGEGIARRHGLVALALVLAIGALWTRLI